MKKKIETNTTINVKIGDYEFNLTKEEAEELYNSLKDSLGKIDMAKWPSPMKDYDDYFKKWKEIPKPIPYNPPYTIPTYPKPIEIWCKINNTQ